MAPFWLPQVLGGQAMYHYVITGSMAGSVDRGSLVMIWPEESYAVGDVVAFWQDLGFRQIPVLHRIIDKTPEGLYVIKGDAVDSVDYVPPERIIGRMVFGIPYLGFVGGAAKFFPLVLAYFALAPFLAGRKGKEGKPVSAFLPTAALVLVCMPLASVGIVQVVGKTFAMVLMLALLGTARLLEIAWGKELGPLTEILYGTIGVAALSMVYIPEVIQQLRGLFAA
ncbi:MAG: S24/S26 family peptidase [Dehalococcoidia bacterium]|nr:S24/S26 family peptidase [Dehalococcoidia bacterium]MDW8119639.1 S24/S26 family peptidase [Chloroflexota bacterium]